MAGEITRAFVRLNGKHGLIGGRGNSKAKSATILAVAAGTAVAALLSTAASADVLQNTGGTAGLDQASSWFDLTTSAPAAAAPGAADIARWDGGSPGGIANLNAATSWLGIVVTSPAAAVGIGDGATDTGNLTLGSAGIDMSAATQNLSIADPLALGANQTWNVASGRTLTITNATNLTPSAAAALTISGAGNIVFGTTSTAAVTVVSPAVISGAGGSLIKNGTGTLTLAGINTYNGGTTVNNGKLVLNMAGSGVTGAANGNINTLAGVLTVGGGNVLVQGGSRLSGSASNFAFVNTINTLNVGAGDSQFTEARGSSARTITTFTNLTRQIGGTVGLTDALNGDGTSNSNGGGYRAKNAADGNTQVVNGVIPFMTYSTTSTATSWFAPSTTSPGTSNSGTAYSAFTASTGTALGSSTQNVDVVSTTADNPILPAGTPTTVNTLRFNSGNSHNITIGSSASDTLTIGAGGILVTGAYANHQAQFTNGTLMGGQPGAGQANELVIIDYADPAAGSNAKMTINSVIADNTTNGNPLGSATALTKSGIGLLNLTNTANTYTGRTYLNGGTIQIAGDGSLGQVPGSTLSDSMIFGGGTLQFGANNITVNPARGMTLADKGGAISAGTTTTAFNGTYGGVIAGTGPFTKSGVGRLSLTGANTYTGNTLISAGTLLANNTSGSATGIGAVTVSGGGALGGTGTVSGLVTLASNGTAGAGGHIAPGDPSVSSGVGTLTVGGASLTSGSAADFEFSSNVTYDKVISSGVNGLNIASGAGINLFNAGSTSAFAPSGDHTYNLFQYSGSLGGAASNLSVLNPVTGLNYTFGTSGGFVTLEIVGTAPSASTWNVDASGGWDVGSNWTNGSPNAIGSSASFLGAITAPRTVSLNGSQTVGTITFNNAASYTIVPGTGGTLTLNNGVGATTVTDSAGSHAINVPVSLDANTTFTVTNSTDSLTMGGNISGAGTLTTAGNGTLILTGSNTYASNTTIGAGSTVQLGGPANTTGGTLGGTTVIDNGTLAFARSDTSSFNLPVSGSGGLLFNGTGTTTLGGANTYTGTTTINAGSVKIGNTSALGTSAVTLSGTGTLDLNGNSTTLGSIGGTGGIVDNSSATPVTLTLGNTTSPTFSGVIQNTGAALTLDKVGTGTLTLGGTNTYTGGTTIDAGVLKVNADNNLGNASGAVTINAGTLEIATGYSSSRVLNFNNAASTVQVDAGQTYTQSDPAGVTGTALTKTGTGTFEVTGPLVLSGTATVSNGILTLKSPTGNTFGASPTITGGTNAAPAELRVDTGASLTLPSASVGNSTLVGLLHVNGGSLTVTGTTSLGGVSNSGGGGAITVEAGSTVSLGAINFGTNDGGNLNFKGGTITTGAITIPRSGAVTGGASPDYSHGIIVSGANVTMASVALGTGNSWGSLLVSSGTATVTGSVTVGNQVTANRGGAIKVTGGTLTISDPGGIQLGLKSANNSIAEFAGGTTTTPKLLMIHDDTITSGTANVTVDGGSLYIDSGGIEAHTAGGAAAVVTMVSGTLGASADWTGNPTVSFGGGGNIQTADASNVPHNITLTGPLAGAGIFNVTGGGTLTYSGTDAHQGDTNVMSGTLTIAPGGSLGFGSGVNVNVSPGATLNMNGTLEPTATAVNDNGTANFGGNTSTSATATRAFAGLNILSNSLATVTPSVAPFFPMILSPASLTFADGTSKLDLTNNELLVNDSLGNVVGEITGHKIVSTSTGGGLGSLDLGTGQVEVRFTLLGDTNLDGSVDVTDLGNLASNYGATTGAKWVQGDTNYNGAVDVTDLGNLASNYGGRLAGGSSVGGGDMVASSMATVATGGSAAVPEPASLGLLTLGLSSLLVRRRRRTRLAPVGN